MKWIAIIGKEIIKSITKLGVETKLLLTAIVALYPFWFLAVYLFGHNFYISNPIWISIIVAYCLTMVWHFAVLPVTIFFNELINGDGEINSSFLVSNMVNSMSIISLFMFLAFTNTWSMSQLVLYSFLPVIAIQLIYGVIIGINKAKAENSLTKPTNEDKK